MAAAYGGHIYTHKLRDAHNLFNEVMRKLKHPTLLENSILVPSKNPPLVPVSRPVSSHRTKCGSI